MRCVLPGNWIISFSIVDHYAVGGLFISLMLKKSADLMQGFLADRKILEFFRKFCEELETSSFGFIFTAALLDEEKILKAFKAGDKTGISE